MQTLRCPRKLTILSKLIVLSALTGLAPAGAAEPLMPVSNQQCEQLQREASKARMAISHEADQCATNSPDRKRGVIGQGMCANWVPRECASIVPQCEDRQARAEVSVASCREKVADLRDQLKDKAREAAIDAADARVGGGVRTVTNTLDKYQHTRDSAQAALDFFGGKQTPTEQYGAVSDLARGLHGAGTGSPVAREFFDRSLTEINTVHAAALQQLDATIAAIQGISPSPPRAAPPVFAARPDPALRAREAALRNEITTNSQRLEQQQVAMVREREASEARERQAVEERRSANREAAERDQRRNAEARRQRSEDYEREEERDEERNYQARRNARAIQDAVQGAVQGIQAMQQRVDSYRSMQQQQNTYSSPSYGGGSSYVPNKTTCFGAPAGSDCN